jgi:NAD(P)-dependent dehydrogenase (short-subunit alcohol dehydrogenase family)
MDRLQDRVAIITGGGDGIGRGIARAFAREGARVLVAELHESTGAAVAAELVHEFGADAASVTTDVADKAAVLAMVDAAIDRWGTVDILVNNAWGGGSLGRLEYKTDEQMAHGLQVGFYGPLWAMQAVLPTMRT